jgi:thioredoxin:protein disulfide reductase
MKRLLCASFAALSLAAGPPNPVTWKIESAPDKPVKAGARFTVKLTAHILEGWHFYSMKPIEDGPIPTRIWLAESQPFQLTGTIGAEEPQTLLDETLHKDIELYEGSATFSLPVRVTSGSETGPRKLLVNAQTQSCNNSMCLPPTTVKVEVPVTVGK